MVLKCRPAVPSPCIPRRLPHKILLVDTAIVGIAAVIGTKAVQASSHFGASLSDLNRFLSEGEGDASAYRQTFENLSVQYGTGINEIVASTADWKAANFDLNQSLDLTRIALDYAIAGQIEAGEATDLLKKIIAGMADEQDKATEASKRFGDVINYIADSSTVNFKELALGVAEISPSINQTGASFEQITGIIAALTDVTQSGSQSASALALIMGQLKSPSNQAEAALKEFGLTVAANGVTQQSFYEILSKVAAKWPDLTNAEKASYAQRLVSAEQVDEFSAIMNNWGKATEYATGAVGGERSEPWRTGQGPDQGRDQRLPRWMGRDLRQTRRSADDERSPEARPQLSVLSRRRARSRTDECAARARRGVP